MQAQVKHDLCQTTLHVYTLGCNKPFVFRHLVDLVKQRESHVLHTHNTHVSPVQQTTLADTARSAYAHASNHKCWNKKCKE